MRAIGKRSAFETKTSLRCRVEVGGEPTRIVVLKDSIHVPSMGDGVALDAIACATRGLIQKAVH